jgi:alkyl sulfatase BDS1-like metallo-beta-lactamase superfamily hydrolase
MVAVVRFLTPEWFAEVGAASAPTAETSPDVVVGQVVTNGPHGEVRYRVEVRGARATLVPGTNGEADMTFTSDYTTAAAIARGDLSTHAALLEGRIHVSGSPSALADRLRTFAPSDTALDPVPASVRAKTTYQ